MNSLEKILKVKQESLRILALHGANIDRESVLLDPNVKLDSLKTLFEGKQAIYNFFLHEKYIPQNQSLDDMSLWHLQSGAYGKTDKACEELKQTNPLSADKSREADPNKIFVFFARSESNKDVAISEITKLCKLMLLYGCARGIIITQTKLNSSAASSITNTTDFTTKKEEEEEEIVSKHDEKNTKKSEEDKADRKILKDGVHKIKHFLMEDLLYDPSEGVYAGKYELLPYENAKLYLKNNPLKLTQLVKVSINDIIIKRIGAEDGDIVKISRKSTISGTFIEEDITYALVYTPPPEKKKALKKVQTEKI